MRLIEEAFVDYKYIDEGHKYIYLPKNKRLTSITQFISKLKEAFDTRFWSVLKAFEYSGYTIKSKNPAKNYFYINESEKIIPGETDLSNYNLSHTPELIKKQWETTTSIGNNRGSYLHKFLENAELGIEEPKKEDFMDNNVKAAIQSENTMFEMFPTFVPQIENSYDKVKQLAESFLLENDYLIPHAIESVVGDFEIGLAGTFDRLYFNELSQSYEIWDFKTDKKLEFTSKYNKKLKLFNIDDCEYNKYSLQVSLYKYILTKKINIEINDCYIVHFNINENRYEIIKLIDYTELIKTKVNEYEYQKYL